MAVLVASCSSTTSAVQRARHTNAARRPDPGDHGVAAAGDDALAQRQIGRITIDNADGLSRRSASFVKTDDVASSSRSATNCIVGNAS
jgi:hypothetical protein